jgi:hypothetical protein
MRKHPDSFWDTIPISTLWYVHLLTQYQNILLTQLHSVIELNVGIICSCIPVICVPLKQLAKHPRILAIVNLFGSLSTRRPSYVDDDNQKRTNNLPQVPKGSLQSLKTIFRNFNRTQRNDATQTSTSSQGQSIEEMYHEFLRADRQNGDAAASV